MGLAQQTRGFSLGFAIVAGIRNFLNGIGIFFRKLFSALFSKMPAITQMLISIALVVLVFYISFLMTR
jgi:hypothetical protein